MDVRDAQALLDDWTWLDRREVRPAGGGPGGGAARVGPAHGLRQRARDWLSRFQLGPSASSRCWLEPDARGAGWPT